MLLRAVEAPTRDRRLTLVDLVRSWLGAERIRAPLKALDRLPGNPHLYAECEQIYRRMTRWLVCSSQSVIVVDWLDLKEDRSWHLRALRYRLVVEHYRFWIWCFRAASKARPRLRISSRNV